MPPGEMQVDRCFFKVAMPQQHLDGAQVGTSFEQVSGKTVAQGMGMDVLVFKTGAFGGVSIPQGLSPKRKSGRVGGTGRRGTNDAKGFVCVNTDQFMVTMTSDASHGQRKWKKALSSRR
jgi:hypothetical protein